MVVMIAALIYFGWAVELLLQAAGAGPINPTSQTIHADPLATQLTVAGAVSVLLNWLKNKTWFPFVTSHSGALNKITSAAVAIATAAGISWQWNGAAHQLVFNGLYLSSILMGLWTAAQQWMFQQAWYQAIVKPGQLGVPDHLKQP